MHVIKIDLLNSCSCNHNVYFFNMVFDNFVYLVYNHRYGTDSMCSIMRKKMMHDLDFESCDRYKNIMIKNFDQMCAKAMHEYVDESYEECIVLVNDERVKHDLCGTAAFYGLCELLKFAHENGCTWNMCTCEYAASYGHPECLKYAIENDCEWDGWF